MKEKQKIKGTLIKFRKNIITGIITILPLYITYVIFSWLMKFLHNRLNFISQRVFPDNNYLVVSLEVIIFILLILLLYFIGLLANFYIGRKIIKTGDKFLNKIPLIRNIYTGSKQILSSFTLNNKKAFRKVVMIEYPRKGLISLAFLTGDIEIEGKKSSKKLATVFLPSTPNPTTGFLLLIPKKDITPLSISVEEAVKLIISGGVLGDKLKLDD